MSLNFIETLVKPTAPTIKSLSSITPEPASEQSAKPANFRIVGIGASAGGLEAFEQFFQHMAPDSGMAFVLVPHLDPSHGSLLTEILQRSTSMQVVEAQDQVKVSPNCIYIIPPNSSMEITRGKLQLSAPTVPRGQRLPIDGFLRSLAEDRQENAVGIVLSGTGTDGTLGLRAILGMGGVTLVQEPSTAKYDGMPSSAIGAGYATMVLSPEKMTEALLAEPGKVIIDTEITAKKEKRESGMSRVLAQLRARTGHDFSLYKPSTIGRRITRRMLQHNLESIDHYIRYLKENPAEVHALFKELLINVTNFFRDPEAFSVLEENILPLMVKDKPDDYVFRVWVVGCASGEEGYSVAILFRELMDKLQREFKVQIYCTDLDDEAIAMARMGSYPLNIVQDITPERLHRFFIMKDTSYRVRKELREMVVFAVQNVIKDPPFTKLDLLCCRNLLIYLKPELQDRLIPEFHYALKPEGVLFLSPSESIGNHTDLFKMINRKWKIYRALHSLFPSRTMVTQGLTWSSGVGGKTLESGKTDKETNFADLTRRLLVQYFAPASVITDSKGEILYIHGDTGKFLRPAPGQPTHNILEMAREGLAMELHNSLHAAASEKMTILNRLIQVKTNGGFTPVNLSVRPMADPEGKRNLLLVSFQEVAEPPGKTARKRIAKTGEKDRFEELEAELNQLQINYQSSLEEQQASNEELKSANEELQSTNEELQSTNEELETSQEELQSVNEELVTVNSELQAKIEQLAGMQNDMKNLLDNINIGIIFLDRHLIIRRFTREAVRIYRLVASDVGRPLNDIKSLVDGDELLTAARDVLDSLIPYEREIQIGEDKWVLARIQPYRTLDNMIDGVVLTFTDITSRIKAIAVNQALALAEGVVNTIHSPFLVLNNAWTVISASPSFYQEFNMTREETLNHELFQLKQGLWNIAELRAMLETVLTNDRTVKNYRVDRNIPGVGQRKMEINISRFMGKAGAPQMILLSMEINP
jgi:two-component system CheB/CheR fusion protein